MFYIHILANVCSYIKLKMFFMIVIPTVLMSDGDNGAKWAKNTSLLSDGDIVIKARKTIHSRQSRQCRPQAKGMPKSTKKGLKGRQN